MAEIDVEKRQETKRRVLILLGVALGGFIIFGKLAFITTNEDSEENKRLLNDIHTKETLENSWRSDATSMAEDNNEGLQDSLATEYEETLKETNPEKFVSVDVTWRKKGVASVPMVQFTFSNESTKEVVNPEVLLTFSGIGGAPIRKMSETIDLTIPAGAVRRSEEVNIGFNAQQFDELAVEYIRAEYR